MATPGRPPDSERDIEHLNPRTPMRQHPTPGQYPVSLTPPIRLTPLDEIKELFRPMEEEWKERVAQFDQRMNEDPNNASLLEVAEYIETAMFLYIRQKLFRRRLWYHFIADFKFFPMETWEKVPVRLKAHIR
ncbi:hypothetical protein N7495_008454 [Penicillium taxi]|uniref:uncharacterized protein n=1 Tax=Penicillium taxi TaxID=168475 RepID=UPI002545571B|nr:uncharacterized protein N7495_008454 [Penicillium taxi]KAJ5888413.1 hypothetical protein N7495_008454 [Penicillium taxi]